MAKARLEEICKQLHLSHIPQAVESNTSDTKEDWLIFLLENELKCREKLKTMRLFKQAKIPVQRTLDNYEWHEHIQLPNSTTKDELTSLSFIRQKENAVFVGTPGTGKTHLACAL
ncbi:ATP-binding protein, partial [Enterococcus raffinosus]|uniref:ATP-binding protein n=1 Tax=Enterococcus raffinosus TaxID=71452 RepID=UPI001C112DE4